MCKSPHSGRRCSVMLNMGASAGLSLQPQASVGSLSSLGKSDASDFEFDFSQVHSTDEPPASPKLHNFSPTWESATSSMASTGTYFSSAAEHIYSTAVAASDTIKSRPFEHSDDVVHGMNHEQISSRDGGCLVGAIGGNVDAGVMRTSPDQTHQKGLNLRSLMTERRELEQLPCIAGSHRSYNTSDMRNNPPHQLISRCSPSASNSSSEYTSSSSSPSVSFPSASSFPSQDHQKKSCRRWLLKLDFLQTKKGTSPSSKAVDHPARHDAVNPSLAMLDDLSDTDYDDADEANDHNHAKFDQSPRQSTTCSSRSSMSNSSSALLKGDTTMKGGRKSKCASAPVGSATSSPRAATPFSPARGHAHPPSSPTSFNYTPAGAKRPRSPHAQHYQQQRARADERKRRTSLPYLQSLFGACFLSPPQVAC